MIQDTIQEAVWLGNTFGVWYNGVDISHECKYENGKVVYPEWVVKEIQAAAEEEIRSKKPINRIKRFFGLYKPGKTIWKVSMRQHE